MYRNTQYKAFTLIEILLVVALLAIFASSVIIAVNPVKHFQDARNVDRSFSVNALQSALEQWSADGNKLSELTHGDGSGLVHCDEGNSRIMVEETNQYGEVNLYSLLVDHNDSYLALIPSDPHSVGNDSGFDICVREGSRTALLVSAPYAERDMVIVGTPFTDLPSQQPGSDVVASNPPIQEPVGQGSNTGSPSINTAQPVDEILIESEDDEPLTDNSQESNDSSQGVNSPSNSSDSESSDKKSVSAFFRNLLGIYDFKILLVPLFIVFGILIVIRVVLK